MTRAEEIVEALTDLMRAVAQEQAAEDQSAPAVVRDVRVAEEELVRLLLPVTDPPHPNA